MATIAENLQSLVTCKNDIVTAITNKGIILPENAGFRHFADAIDNIETPVPVPEYGIGNYSTSITSSLTAYTANSNQLYIAHQPNLITLTGNIIEQTWDTVYLPTSSYTIGRITTGQNGYLSMNYLYKIADNYPFIYDKYSIAGKTIQSRIKILEYSGVVSAGSNGYLRARVGLAIELCDFWISTSNNGNANVSTINYLSYDSQYNTYGQRTVDLQSLYQNVTKSKTNTTTIDRSIATNSNYLPFVYFKITPAIELWQSKEPNITSYSNYRFTYCTITEPIHLKYQFDILNIS